MDVTEATDNWLRAQLCRDALRQVARPLHAEGIRLLAIKGIHLAFAVAQSPSYRALCDADVVVLDGDYRRAIDILHRTGRFRVRRDDWSASAVIDAHGRAVDVHRTLLPAFFGSLRIEKVAARATARPDLFGPSVLVPDADDAAVIAIGHFVKDKAGAFGHGLLDRDLEALRTYGGVTPMSVARRLREHGLRRAGLVAFSALRTWSPANEWLEANGPSALERAWATAVAGHFRASSPSRRTAAFFLARTIGDDAPAIAANLIGGTLVRAPFVALESASRFHPAARFL
jgi:hypothetical protein